MISAPLSAAPSPSLTLKVCTWLILTGCLWMVSATIGLCLGRAWDPCVWVAAVIYGTGASVVGYVQYASVFQRRRDATTGSMVLFGAFGLFAVLGLVTFIGESLLEGGRMPPWEFVVLGLTIAVFCGVMVYQSNEWQVALWNGPKVQPIPSPSFRFSLRQMLFAMAVLGFSISTATWAFRSELPRIGEHVETKNPPFQIPVGATDICWRQSSIRGGLVYEFTADEETFHRWVRDELKWKATAEGRTETFTPNAWGIGADVETYKVRPPLTDPFGNVTVTDGIRYTWNTSAVGWIAVWDRKTSRVYCVWWSD